VNCKRLFIVFIIFIVLALMNFYPPPLPKWVSMSYEPCAVEELGKWGACNRIWGFVKGLLAFGLSYMLCASDRNESEGGSC